MKNRIAAGLLLAALPFNVSADAKPLSVPQGQPVLGYDGDIPVVETKGHPVITIEILQRQGGKMRVSYNLTANSGINENSQTFAIYSPELAPPRIRETGPRQCAAFFNTRFDYTTLSRTEADIDLTNAKSVMASFSRYGCVLIHNQKMIKDGTIPVLNVP